MLQDPDLLYLAAIDFPSPKARAIQIVHTCHALARSGARVTLVVGRRRDAPLAEQLAAYGLPPEPRLRIVGVPTFRLPPAAPPVLASRYTHFWHWSYLLAISALLPGLLRERPDAVLVRDYRLAWLLIKLARWLRMPLLFEVHGLPSAELLDRAAPTAAVQPAPAVQKEAARRAALERTVFAGAERLLTITDCLRSRLVSAYGVAPDRIVTVPDATRALATDGPARTRAPGSPDRPARLIYVGQLYPHKGVELLIRAMAEVPRGELLIVGGLEDDPNRAALERLTVQLGAGQRVRFHGPSPYEKVPGLLASADCALLPLGEGVVARCFTSPLKLFDYLAAGLPIVAADYPTIREVLRDGHNGLLVAPHEPAAFAAAVNRLIDDPALAARLAEQARRDSAAYSWDRRAERILAALETPSAALLAERA